MIAEREAGARSIPKLGVVIAIDGPAGTGKSSVTKRLAELLDFVHVDTGALYRAIAYLTLEVLPEPTDASSTVGDPSKNSETEERLATEIARSAQLEFQRIPKKNPANRIFANGKDLTSLIRTPEVSMASSRISTYSGVRASLLGLQRRLGCQGKAILEGRDIGTVVFPDAEIKFFLNASVDERAKRRLAELEASGADAPSYEEIKKQIADRDHSDMNRKIAPLRKASDAIELDTTSMTLDEVVKKMEEHVRHRLQAKGSL